MDKLFIVFLLGFAFINAQDLPAELDVIIRDFEVTHPDFENFTEEQENIKAKALLLCSRV